VTGLLDRSSQISSLQNHRALVRQGRVRNLPQVYVPAGKGTLPELYLRNANAKRLISRLKWFISTCIVGAAGVCVIGIAMYTSTNMEDGTGVFGSFRRAGLDAMKAKAPVNLVEDRGAAPGVKTDKITVTTKGLSTKYIIQDSIVERRNAREFITVKPYVRIAATLSTVKPENNDAIPAFNPFDLYAEKKQGQDGKPTLQGAPADKPASSQFVTSRLLELAGGFLPEEDKQDLADEEAERYVAEADAVYAESAAQLRPAIIPEEEPGAGGKPGGQVASNEEKPALPPHTTVLEKIVEDDDVNDGNEMQSVIAKQGDTIVNVLKTAGAESWQAQSIAEVFASMPGGGLKLRAGQEVRLELAPAATDPSLKEPVKVSVFSGVKPEGTAERTDDGEYRLSDKHIQVAGTFEDDDDSDRATLYSSIYSSALAQDLEPDVITTLLRVLSYDVDYKQRVRPGDGFELFFDVRHADDGSETPGELLYVAMTVGNEPLKYYRFRTPDGAVDFYNSKGSNSRKFLMRTPIKAGRFTSGFGYRRHPLLGIKKMHTGVDWAAPVGTPIMAAGNGTIEVADRHGGNGNYVRIRHGNGYKTAYSHMSRFATGIKKGMKVHQGELIGYVGTTGFSTGPHLHYEVLINSRFTNPLKLHVPRSRQLNGRMYAEFRKEMQRIDDLMHRAPVKTRIAAAKD
jgi:murein DD-endopeptidase MepM/ murein hydrolase activator NlpD